MLPLLSGPGYCHGCEYCLPCSHDIDMPGICNCLTTMNEHPGNSPRQ